MVSAKIKYYFTFFNLAFVLLKFSLQYQMQSYLKQQQKQLYLNKTVAPVRRNLSVLGVMGTLSLSTPGIDSLGRSQSIVILIRILQVVLGLLLCIWVFGYLGGVSLSPKVTDEVTGENETFGIFNWHPILMTLAFVGAMAEAILTYSSPLIHIPGDNRLLKKYVHGGLHLVAVVLTVLGIVAAIQSHTLKKPMAMPNFYSTHSFLGILTCCMMVGQMALGCMAYLFPQWSLPERQAFSPVHKFFGGATFCVGMATVMVGLQEKTTFLQLVKHPSVRSGMMQIPAFMQVLSACFTVLVMFQVVASAILKASNSGFRTVSESDIILE